METGWNLFNNSSSSSGVRGQNGNCTNNNPAWGIWELGNLHNNNSFNQDTFNFPSSSSSSSSSAIAAVPTTTTTTYQQESAMHALMFATHQSVSSSSPSSSSFYNGGGSCYYPDPHLTCLKLGKRHYFENASPLENRQTTAAYSITKRGKPYYEHGGFGGGGGGDGGGGGRGGLVGHSTSAAVTVAAPAMAPRCQVEGCNVVLLNAKDYHRRHKVCEVHSKAPKVVVLGVEQRFCQQCSRFHAVSEFDDSKRSCRRRLAGHNERRRKSSQDHSTPRNMTQDDKMMAGRYPYLPLNSSGALSLLSSKNDSWMSSPDLSARCSAALRELIAENRAAIVARQLILDRNCHWRSHPIEDQDELQNGSNSFESCPQQMVTEPHSWENVNAGTHLTLDLKQTPSSAFGYLSMQGKSKEEECSELWGAFKGTRVL